MEDFVNESPGGEAVFSFGGGGGGFGGRSGADAWLEEGREVGVKLLDLIVDIGFPRGIGRHIKPLPRQLNA
jgi:hypothetical protein